MHQKRKSLVHESDSSKVLADILERQKKKKLEEKYHRFEVEKNALFYEALVLWYKRNNPYHDDERVFQNIDFVMSLYNSVNIEKLKKEKCSPTNSSPCCYLSYKSGQKIRCIHSPFGGKPFIIEASGSLYLCKTHFYLHDCSFIKNCNERTLSKHCPGDVLCEITGRVLGTVYSSFVGNDHFHSNYKFGLFNEYDHDIATGCSKDDLDTLGENTDFVGDNFIDDQGNFKACGKRSSSMYYSKNNPTGGSQKNVEKKRKLLANEIVDEVRLFSVEALHTKNHINEEEKIESLKVEKMYHAAEMLKTIRTIKKYKKESSNIDFEKEIERKNYHKMLEFMLVYRKSIELRAPIISKIVNHKLPSRASQKGHSSCSFDVSDEKDLSVFICRVCNYMAENGKRISGLSLGKTEEDRKIFYLSSLSLAITGLKTKVNLYENKSGCFMVTQTGIDSVGTESKLHSRFDYIIIKPVFDDQDRVRSLRRYLASLDSFHAVQNKRHELENKIRETTQNMFDVYFNCFDDTKAMKVKMKILNKYRIL